MTERALAEENTRVIGLDLTMLAGGAMLLLLGGCAGIAQRPQVTVQQPAPVSPPPQPTTQPQQWAKVRSAITEEAQDGAKVIAGVARKSADTVKTGAGKVISGADKIMSVAHLKSVPSKYPYEVCAQPGQVSSHGFCWPTYGRVSRGKKRGHQGVDVLAPTGTPVYASKSGTVIYAGRKLSGFGNVVVLDHGDKVATVYGHNSKLLVQTGDTVRGGQQIACVGQTGRATAPHCHFEIRQDGCPLDPESLLP